MASNNPKVIETLRRIQEEAKRKVAEARAKRIAPAAPKQVAQQVVEVVKEVVKDNTQQVLQAVKEGLTGATGKVVSQKAAREFLGDLQNHLQDAARTVSQQVQVDENFRGIHKDEDGNLVIYPNNCKLHVQAHNGKGAFIIEEPPQLRTILHSRTARGGGVSRVPLPYSVFVIGYNAKQGGVEYYGMGMGYGKKPIRSLDDQLLTPLLPHVQQTGICQPLNVSRHPTLTDLAEDVIGVFWQSAFVYAFNGFSLENGAKLIHSWKEWEKLGEGNPLDILKGDFPKGLTVRQILNHFTQQREGNRNVNNFNTRLQGAVARLVSDFNRGLTDEALTTVIQETALEIVNQALQNSDSALQPK